jgi:acetate kinase
MNPRDDYALVLNAGSSSLKFCVYRRPEAEAWRLEARGQIEGIGTSPRLTAKDEAGAVIADQQPGAVVRDGKSALD